MHQPFSWSLEGPSGDSVLDIEIVQMLRENVTQVYAQRTGKPFPIVWDDMDRDLFMSATEAKAYGIVDYVGQ